MTEPTPDFVRGLFEGRIDSASILPFPSPDAETAEMIDQIAGMVADWAADAIDPEAIDRGKEIPAEVLSGLAELGLFGLTLPEEHGGAGMGQLAYARVMETLAHRCASTVTVLGAHLGIGMKALLLYGTDEQQAKWLPDLASGRRIAAFALTEAGAGSDAAALRTSADPQPDGSWKINGRKIWITNGAIANCYSVFARTPDPERPDAPLMERPISAFFVPAELPGVSHGVPENKMGLCGSNTTEVGFEDVVVPADSLVGERGQGFKVALNVLNGGRHGLAACCVGQAKLARDGALAHARERIQFGRPIADFGMVQEMLAGMDADIYAMEAGFLLTAGHVDAGGRETMLEAACCKMYATERLWQVANDALQVTGGTGFMREYPFERILRDARINMIFEGTNQVLRMMIGAQGLRGLVRASAAAPSEPQHLTGVHASFEEERAAFDVLAPGFFQSCQRAAETHGAQVRSAQFVLRRLSDMACALFQYAAVLSRVSSSEEAGTATDQERDLARLACRRLAKDFHRAVADERAPDDALIESVARAMA